MRLALFVVATMAACTGMPLPGVGDGGHAGEDAGGAGTGLPLGTFCVTRGDAAEECEDAGDVFVEFGPNDIWITRGPGLLTSDEAICSNRNSVDMRMERPAFNEPGRIRWGHFRMEHGGCLRNDLNSMPGTLYRADESAMVVEFDVAADLGGTIPGDECSAAECEDGAPMTIRVRAHVKHAPPN